MFYSRISVIIVSCVSKNYLVCEKKHCFHKRRRQQHLYFKTRACSQRLRKAYHHRLLWNRSTTVNKVRGIEKETFANYWRQKYPNGTLLWWKKANKNDILLHTRFRERCSTVPHQGVIFIRSRYSQTRTPFRSRKQHTSRIKHVVQRKPSARTVFNWTLRCQLTTHCRKKVTCTGNNL